MSTYTQILYQIVFSTKHRQHTLRKEDLTQIFKYINGICKNHKCKVYQIGGVSNHIHIVTHLHPSVSLSSLVKDIKIASNKFIKEDLRNSKFESWQVGYSAFTYSIEAKENLINYVKNQEEHHRSKTFQKEVVEFLREHKVDYDERYLD